MNDSQTVTRDTTPDPAVVQDDVGAVLQGLRARQGAARTALPSQLQPGYRSTMPAPLQSPAPWAQPIQLQPEPQPAPVTQQPAPVTPPVTQQAVAQPPPLQPRPGEAPPLRNMPMLWNGNQVGPSGQTKQQFLLGRMMHESQGDPSVLNYVARNDPRMYDRGFTASGLLQDLNTTWARGVQWALADPAKYPMSTDPRQFSEARQAPWDVQWQVNSAIYDHAGETPWHADGGRGLRAMRGMAGVRDAYQASYEQPAQTYAPATPRDFHSWGQSPEGQPGRQQDTPTIMERFAPLLVGIASLALRLPLSTAITAYGAMARAQQNGQQLEYERNRTKYQDALKEATAQQQLESRAASDAFETYGTNNPEGLQQELARIALQYNDPVMLRLAEQGDLNRIHQLQQRRDALNQNLQRTKELQELQDQEEVDRTVKADMAQWDKEHPDATPEERQIAEFETRTKRQNEMAGKRTGGAGAQGAETGIYDVIRDGKPTGQQVRLGKDGRYLDPNSGQPVQLQPGETVQERARERAAGAGEGMEGPVYDVIKDGKPTGRQVRAGKQGGLFDVGTSEPYQLQPGETVQQTPRERQEGAGGGVEAPLYNVLKDGKPTGRQVRLGKQGGYFDADTQQPVHLQPGESVQEAARAGSASALEAGKPFDIVDDKGHVVPGGQGVMLRERRDGAGYVYAETGEPLQLKPGEHVRQITPTTSGGGRAGAQVLRQLVGGREVLSDLQNVVRLPVGTTIGPLGTSHPGPTIMDALRGDLARKLTDQDSQLMQASMASMSRELSILMSPVYGGNWAAQQIDPLIPKSGDTMQTVVFKLARLAQSADNALEAAATSPILSNEEQEYARDLRRQISEAIPWSTAEAMDFTYRGHPKESFGSYVQRQGIHGAPAAPGGGQSGLPPGVTVEVK